MEILGRQSRCLLLQGLRAAAVIAVVVAVISGICDESAKAEGPDSTREYEVKAAFIYNFARFVEWPASTFPGPDAPLVLCVLGKDPFGQTLEHTVQGKTVGGRSFVVRRVKSLQDLKPCQILFVPASEKERIEQAINAAKDDHVLTVGEVAGFARRGGVINFVIEEGRVRFEINTKAAKRAGLTLSSKLLSLAKVVTDTN